MKAKQEIAFEHIVDDKIYKFTLPHGAPLGEAYQAAIIFLEEMVRMINEHTEKTLKKEGNKGSSVSEGEELKKNQEKLNASFK